MAARDGEHSINLVLVGNTQYGKGSTADSIIGEKKFKSSTKICQREVATVHGHNVVVVNTPSLGDSFNQKLVDTATAITMALTHQPEGFDAFLIVIPFGKKLTEEDKSICKPMETIFGEAYIKQHGILVVTHADLYDVEENDYVTLEKFLQRQKGVFQMLREKCDNRMVVFDNKTRDQSIHQNQVKSLLDMVTEMKKTSIRYPLSSLPRNLRANIDSQAEMMPAGLKETVENITIFIQDHENISLEKLNVKQLTEIKTKLKEYREELTEKNANNNSLTSLISRTSKLEDDVIARLGNIQRKTGYRDGKTYCEGEDFINFLLVGKTGHGKSSTGNCILGEKMFTATADTTSTTKECQREVATVHGHNLVIVDSPGLADTDIETDGGLKQLANEIINIFATQPDGFDVILITIPYGSRITAEDKRVFQELDLLLGKEYVNHCGILVVTHVDQYESEGNELIKEFMERQTGEFQYMRQNRVNNRVVYFDNRTKDESVRQAQVKELLDMAVSVKKDSQTFTPEVCVRAQKTRDEALRKAGKPVIRSETTDKLTLIMRELLGIASESKDIRQLKSILAKLEELQIELNEQAEGHKMQGSISFTVNRLVGAIKIKISAIDKKGDVKVTGTKIREEISALAQLIETHDRLKYFLVRHDLGPVLATFIYPVLAISSFFKKIVRNVPSFVTWLLEK